MQKNELLQINFNLPSHKNELDKVTEIINNFKIKIKLIEIHNNINPNLHTQLYEEVIKILDYIGRLSNPAFNVQEELERLYTLHYKSSPHLGKHLWTKHYEQIHKPYNLLKNRCHNLLDTLDEIYINKFNTTPPNWKI